MNKQEQDVDVDTEGSNKGGDLKSPKRPYSKLAVELTDDDLQSPGVQKLLLAEISRLEHHSSNYEFCKDALSIANQKCAVLEEKQRTSVLLEVLYSAGLGVGATLVGLTPSVKESAYSPMVVLGLGAVLIVIAVVAKLRHK